MERKTLSDITHNAQLKQYPDGSAVLFVSNNRIFREPGWESDPEPRQGRVSDEQRRGAAEDLERARRRARSMVSDYARANSFAYFVTLTLDAEIVDRYDITAVLKKMRVWLSNAVRRHGLVYILVPEFHQDGAIHFHGLVNDAFKLVDSGTVKIDGQKKPRKPRSKAQRAEWLASGGHVVYNIPEYKLGFSTAIELYGDYRRAVAYVCKYIGKDGTDQRKIGGRWYYSGGNLKRPSKEYFDMDYDAVRDGEHTFTIPRLGAECVKLEIEV